MGGDHRWVRARWPFGLKSDTRKPTFYDLLKKDFCFLMMKWLGSEMRGLPRRSPSCWRKYSQEDKVWECSRRIQRTCIAKIYVIDR
jgi:hypothetical protein